MKFTTFEDEDLIPVSEVIDDTTPQLGGNLDVNGKQITSVSNGNIALMPNGTGKVGIGTTSPGVKLQVNGGNQNSPTLGSAVGAFALVGSDSLYGMYAGISTTGDAWLQAQRNDGNTAVYKLLLNPSGGYVGIATTTPAQKLDINGGHLRFTPVDPPQVTATLALNGAGVLTGDYYYKYTYYTNDGETSPGAFSLKISPSSQKVLVTMTNSSNPLTVGKKLYRAKTASSSPYYYVATIADNTTTTYDDNIADTSLGTVDVKYKSNETAGKIYNGTYLIGFASTNPTGNTTWGSGALADSIGGYSVAVGNATLGYSSSNSYNTAVGGSALGFVSTGDGNTAIGYGAGLGPKGLIYTTSIGRSSGRSLIIAGPSGTAVAGAGIAVGTYYYGVSFVYTLDGVTQESERSFVSSGITTTADNGQINLTSIAKYTGPLNCTARKIYRTKLTDPFTSANEKTMYLVDTIADNITTTYSDTKAEASLGAAFAGFNASTAIGAGSLFYGSNQLIIGGVDATYNLPINNVYWGSGVYGISGTKPNDITIHSSGGFGTDIGGSNMIFAGGKASGSGASGYIAFQTGDVGASGTGEQTLTEKVKIGVGEMVVNDTGASYDFRVEGDTDANLLFTDASADKVGVGMNNPAYKLDVTGDINTTTGYRCGGTAGIDATVTYVDTLLGAKTLTFVKGLLTAQV